MSDTTPSSTSGRRDYATHTKPRLMSKLSALRLDVEYHRGEGDDLFHRDGSGHEVRVLDLVGGYGASLFGHNHPALVATVAENLAARRPFLAQGSVRPFAGRLASRLSSLVGAATGRSYVVTFGATGAEAVEAAVKHAELELGRRVDALVERLARTRRDYFERARVRDAATVAAEDAGSLFERTERDLRIAVSARPTFLAVERAFHGKSLSALSLTASRDFRGPWERLALRVAFVVPDDDEGLARAIDEARVSYPTIELRPDGSPSVVTRDFVNVAACFVEPIQGEGGVREVSRRTLLGLRIAADLHGYPLVIDEIQSGMGRTGTFLASEPCGVRGDYYLMAKALGGGLAKISALLVDRERSDPEFGVLHTSTFAEDDHSSALALAALDLLERDRLPDACRSKGELLLQRLSALAKRYPGVLGAVTGRGLMIGVELSPVADDVSPFLRVLSTQRLLGYLVAGYMLNREHIRVMPTLSAPNTLRIEPSAYLPECEIDRICGAFERVAVALRTRDLAALAGHLGDVELAPDASPAPADLAPDDPHRAAPGRDVRVAFIGHFLEPADLRGWDPGFREFSDGACRGLLDRARRALRPFVVSTWRVESAIGSAVEVTVVGVPFTAEQVMAGFRAGDVRWARSMVADAVRLARANGARVLGFGGYTSILTANGLDVTPSDVTITTGNSLTAAATVDSILRRHPPSTPMHLGIVGALGNIGSVLCDLLSPHASRVVLVGRPGSRRRLLEREVALRSHLNGRIGRAGSLPPISATTEMAALRDCNVIVSATNAPSAVVLPEHVGPGPVLVCDVATPGDVDVEILRRRDDVTLLRGGLVRLPQGQSVAIPGMALEGNAVFGCFAETVLVGLSGRTDGLSLGALTPAGVARARTLALEHGFQFEQREVFPSRSSRRAA